MHRLRTVGRSFCRVLLVDPFEDNSSQYLKLFQAATRCVRHTNTLVAMSHVKARNSRYPGAPQEVERFGVPDEHISWSSEFVGYSPIDYTAAVVLKLPVWADQDIR